MSRLYKQGGLDALCGLYAVANSLRYLGCDRQKINQSLAAAIKELGAATFAKRFLLNEGSSEDYGLSRRHLGRALAAATAQVNREAESPLAVLHFQEPSYSLASFWRTLEWDLTPKPRSCAIIGVSGRINHWTTVIRASESLAQLRDSDGLRVLQKRRCKVRNGTDSSVGAQNFYYLHPHDSFVRRQPKLRPA